MGRSDKKISPDEIEITPFLLKAGATIFLECRSLMTEEPEDAIRGIFTVMLAASRES